MTNWQKSRKGWEPTFYAKSGKINNIQNVLIPQQNCTCPASVGSHRVSPMPQRIRHRMWAGDGLQFNASRCRVQSNFQTSSHTWKSPISDSVIKLFFSSTSWWIHFSNYQITELPTFFFGNLVIRKVSNYQNYQNYQITKLPKVFFRKILNISKT